jgi:GNAT superfamily N-acetyltransferase
MSTLEKISKALAGETLTGGARAVGEAIGYVGAGGDFSDVPQVMKDAIEAQKKRLETGSQGEKDAYSALSALGLVTNPASQIGMGIDFAKALPDLVSAIPERAKAYMAGTADPVGTIAESGLKRRLAKGGAQAEFARTNQLDRAKQNIAKRGIDYRLETGRTEQFLPLQSTRAKWGPGEGKFQVIDDFETRAYDLANKTLDQTNIGMGQGGKFDVVSGDPHELGIEFTHTMGLDPKYRGKGYGKAIYQNMADQYGGGISAADSTSKEARNVYKALGAIDTGIPSGGGMRQALPTTAMKKDPKAMKAFEDLIEEYAGNAPASGNVFDKLPDADLRQLDREFEYMANKNKGFLHESDISDLLMDLYDINLTGRNIPKEIDLFDTSWERVPNTARYRKQN